MLHVPFALLLAAPAALSPLHADHDEATSFLRSNWNKYARRPDGTIEAVFLANDTTTEQRETKTTTERRLLVYDAAQRLVAFALILRSTHTQQMGESPPAFDVVRLQWEGDKIGAVDVVTKRGDYWSPGDPEGLVRRRFRAVPVVASAGAP